MEILAFGGRDPIVPNPTSSYVTTGTFRITNYNSRFNYTGSASSGSVSFSNPTATTIDYTVSDPNSSATVTATFRRSSASGTVYRSAYNYSCQTCTTVPGGDICAPAYDCSGPAGFPGCIPCWGYGPDGYPGADGTICCGWSRGSNPPTQQCSPGALCPAPPNYTQGVGEWYRIQN